MDELDDIENQKDYNDDESNSDDSTESDDIEHGTEDKVPLWPNFTFASPFFLHISPGSGYNYLQDTPKNIRKE